MEIKSLCVSYGTNEVYKNFSLTADDKAVTCILGESGCGKTTLLNAVAGLIPYGGSVSVGKCAYVFQTPRLVPNLTVSGNLRLIGAEEGAIAEMLKTVGLQEKSAAYPKTLSGGEAQRVALCRAFLYPADFLLLDEPFSSLDLKTKLSVMDMFIKLKGVSGHGALFVTHDTDEALYLADRIIVVQGGRIVTDLNNTPSHRTYGIFPPECEKIRQKIVEALIK